MANEHEQNGGLLQAIKQLFTNRNFIIMMLISTFNTAGQVFIKTPTSLFGSSLGMHSATLGAITGTYYLICTICRPITGPLIDRFNKKAVLTFCMLVKLSSYILFVFTTNPTMFTIARYIDGAAFCLCTTCFLTVSSSLVDKKAMGTGIAIYGAFPSVVTMFIPSISMVVYETMGAQSVFIVGAVLLCIAIILIQTLNFKNTVLPQRPVARKKFSFSDVFYLPVVPVAILTFCLGMLLTVNDTYLLLMCEERGISGGAIFFSVQSATALVARLLGGIGSDKFGVKGILIFGCISTAIASILLGTASGVPVLVLCAVLYVLAQKGCDPVIIKGCSLIAPPEKRGAAISTNYFIFDLAGTFAGYICSFLFSRLGYSGMYYVAAIFPMAGMIWMLLSYKKTFGRVEVSQPKA